jgi:hypothetical protein
MKTSPLIRLILSNSLALLTCAQSVAVGAGVAALKEQTFHQDASANVVAYIELKDIGSPFIKINTGSQELTIDRQKLAGKVEVLSALPPNITNESDLDIVRKAAKEYRDFSAKFPKSAPLLANHITALDAYIQTFESGKARYNGKWMPKEEALAMKQVEEQAKQAVEDKADQEQREKVAFEESQKAKGLVKRNSKWISKEEAQRLEAQVQEALKQQAIAEEKRRRAEEQYEEDGLVLLRKTVNGVNNEFGTTITGTVVNCTGKELHMAMIEYKIYDASDAQIGSAVASINGLEAGGRWNFKALGFKSGSYYKISKLSCF